MLPMSKPGKLDLLSCVFSKVYKKGKKNYVKSHEIIIKLKAYDYHLQEFV